MLYAEPFGDNRPSISRKCVGRWRRVVDSIWGCKATAESQEQLNFFWGGGGLSVRLQHKELERNDNRAKDSHRRTLRSEKS